jgi:hypothetical protein
MDNEATLTGSIIRLKSDSTFHIKTWYPTPSISCRDSEVIVDSEEVKAQREQGMTVPVFEIELPLVPRWCRLITLQIIKKS